MSNVFDDRTLAALRRPPRPSATPGTPPPAPRTWTQRPAGLPRRRPTPSSRSATTATWSTPRTWRTRPACSPARSPATPTLMAELLAARAASTRTGATTTLERALVERAAPARGRVLAGAHGPATTSSACATPTASGRCASGKLDGGWVLASETPALDIVGAHFVRELDPGEMVVIDADGVRSLQPVRRRARRPQALPVRVRLLRPPRLAALRPERPPGPGADGRAARRAGTGRGRPGDGRARVRHPRRRGLRPALSGIPFGHGLVKNRYIGRTFIAPSQEMRALGVRMKLNPLRENIAGKRLVVVDDSIVRGTTTRAMVSMLREAGRGRGAPAGVVAAVPLAVLLRHGHRHPGRAARRQHGRSRRSAATSTSTRSPTCTLDRLVDGHRRRRRRVLHGLPHRRRTRCPIPAEAGKGVLEVRRGPSPTDGRRRCRSACWTATMPAAVPGGRGPAPREEPGRVGETYEAAGVSHRGRRGRGRPDQGARPLHLPARGDRRHRRLRRPVPLRRRPATAEPVLVSTTDGVGTKALVAAATRPLRHHRPRPGGDVRRRPGVPGRRAAVLPRLHLDRQARPRPGRATWWPGVAEGCRQAGCALVGGEMAEHPGVMEPGEFDLVGLRGRCGRAGPDARPANRSRPATS